MKDYLENEIKEFAVYSIAISDRLSNLGHKISRTVPDAERHGRIIFYYKYDETINEDFIKIRDERKKNRITRFEADLLIDIVKKYVSELSDNINTDTLNTIISKLSSNYYI